MHFQKYTDRLLERTLLPFIPEWISPNMVSWARIAALPFIYFLLVNENYLLGLIIFSLAALTDALDGAMARVRDRITEVGKVLDPIADRGLLALVALIFIPKYFGWPLLIALALLELVNAGVAYGVYRTGGFIPGANWVGKLKTIVQCLAFISLLIGIVVADGRWLSGAYWLLVLSAVFAFVQMFFYPKTREEAEHPY